MVQGTWVIAGADIRIQRARFGFSLVCLAILAQVLNAAIRLVQSDYTERLAQINSCKVPCAACSVTCARWIAQCDLRGTAFVV